MKRHTKSLPPFDSELFQAFMDVYQDEAKSKTAMLEALNAQLIPDHPDEFELPEEDSDEDIILN
jgi:hypothetical protein